MAAVTRKTGQHTPAYRPHAEPSTTRRRRVSRCSGECDLPPHNCLGISLWPAFPRARALGRGRVDQNVRCITKPLIFITKLRTYGRGISIMSILRVSVCIHLRWNNLVRIRRWIFWALCNDLSPLIRSRLMHNKPARDTYFYFQSVVGWNLHRYNEYKYP